MDDELKELFIHPPYWLLYALPWPTNDPHVGMAEAAVVLAPPCVSERDVSKNAYDIVGFAGLYAREHPNHRLIFLTDVTRWLSRQGGSWAAVGVNVESGLQELLAAPILSMYMSVSVRAYQHIVNMALDAHTIYYTDGTSEQLTEDERERVRDFLGRKIVDNWAGYIRQMLQMGRLTFS